MAALQRINGTFGSSGASYGDPDEHLEQKRARKMPADPNVSTGDGKPAKSEKPKGAKECKAKMLKLLSIRDFTQSSMRERLLKDGFMPSDVDAAIALAVENRFIDDKRFARTYVSQKCEAGWGRGKIESEIEKFGIDANLVSEVFEESFSEDEEVQRAVKAILKHRTSAKNVGDAHYRYLLGKGFSPSVCAKAMRIWRESQ